MAVKKKVETKAVTQIDRHELTIFAHGVEIGQLKGRIYEVNRKFAILAAVALILAVCVVIELRRGGA